MKTVPEGHKPTMWHWEDPDTEERVFQLECYCGWKSRKLGVDPINTRDYEKELFAEFWKHVEGEKTAGDIN